MAYDMRHLGSALITAALGWCGGGALACSPTYTVSGQDTLFTIAEAQLGDLTRWAEIFAGNPDLQGGSLLNVPAGTVLDIPCPAKLDGGVPVQRLRAEDGIRLITGSNYAPFTDEDWLAQGLIVELVNAAFDETPNPVPHVVTWEQDWSTHLFPSLDSLEHDMGFPWLKPDCAANPANARCASFHFSDPVVELVVVLFTPKDRSFAFNTDADLEGKTLCRPVGHFTSDWGQGERLQLVRDSSRKLLSDGGVKLVQPDTAEECFRQLQDDAVDAVAMNEFLGIEKVYEMGLSAQIAPLPRPLSVEGLHLVISKKHWRATAHLHRFNAGLARLRQSDRYREIVARHLAYFWRRIRG